MRCLLKKDHPLIISEGVSQEKALFAQGYIAAEIDLRVSDCRDQIEAALADKEAKKGQQYATKDMAAEPKSKKPHKKKQTDEG